LKKSQEQIGFARELRQEQTDAEKALWMRLRSRQLQGVKFRRQQPIGPYSVDFASFERKPKIEIDGGQHNEERIKERTKRGRLG
jgi:very-short-patch-repair endonuclease